MTERTSKDYAIEFGEYLAKAADAFLDTMRRGVVSDVTDEWRALESAIYEFRKRAAKVMPPPVAPVDRRRFLDDALSYLWYAKEDAGRLCGRLYADWAIKALVAAGEHDIAQLVSTANELANPALYDKAWDRVRQLREGE